MLQRMLLGFAAVGALSLGGCGLSDAVEDVANQVQAEVTERFVKGSLNAVDAAFKGRDVLKRIGGNFEGAPGLLVQAQETEECLDGGTLTFNEDGSSFSIEAQNCTLPDVDSTFTLNGRLRYEEGENPQSGNLTFSYEADLEWRVEDESGNIVEQFVFKNFTLNGKIAPDETDGTLREDYTYNGSFTFVDQSGTNKLTYSNFRIRMASNENQTSAKIAIDGGFKFDLADADCADGEFEFVTKKPLAFSEGAECPNAGVIEVNGVTYSFFGDSITATSGDASESFTCSDLTGNDQCSLDDGKGDESFDDGEGDGSFDDGGGDSWFNDGEGDGSFDGDEEDSFFGEEPRR